MNIAVIGANGFLGSFLAKRMAGVGQKVIHICRGESLPAGMDVVIDCNGDPRRFWANENPAASFAANVASVSERLREPTALYIYMSTIDVYGSLRSLRDENHEDAIISTKELDVYGFHKYMAEQLVAFHAPRHLILRLGTLIGPNLKKNPAFDALNGNPIRQPRSSTLSLVDLEHVGQALDLLLTAGKTGVFNVTGQASVSIDELLSEVYALGGPEPHFHAELLATSYDISIDKISAHLAIPTSLNMLRDYVRESFAARVP